MTFMVHMEKRDITSRSEFKQKKTLLQVIKLFKSMQIDGREGGGILLRPTGGSPGKRGSSIYWLGSTHK